MQIRIQDSYIDQIWNNHQIYLWSCISDTLGNGIIDVAFHCPTQVCVPITFIYMGGNPFEELSVEHEVLSLPFPHLLTLWVSIKLFSVVAFQYEILFHSLFELGQFLKIFMTFLFISWPLLISVWGLLGYCYFM